jgi:hypothetical protein
MKRTLGLMILLFAIVGCQKAPTESRIGSSPVRSNGLPPGATTTPSGITLNGIVTLDSAYQSDFDQEVRDFLAGSINPDYIGTVSSQGANQTGVYVGGKVTLQNGQTLSSVANGRVDITPTSELLVAVYDKFQDQANLAPLPPIYLKQSSGYVSGNNIFMDFYDNYGSVHLEGTYDRNVAKLTFSFNTTRTFDGNVGQAGTLGVLSIPTCQFFRCQ